PRIAGERRAPRGRGPPPGRPPRTARLSRPRRSGRLVLELDRTLAPGTRHGDTVALLFDPEPRRVTLGALELRSPTCHHGVDDLVPDARERGERFFVIFHAATS